MTKDIAPTGPDPAWHSEPSDDIDRKLMLLAMMDAPEGGMPEDLIIERFTTLKRLSSEALIFHMVWTGELIYCGDGEDVSAPEPMFRPHPEILKSIP